MDYEKFKEQYPHWFDGEGKYIEGSLENQRERIKDDIFKADVELSLFGKTAINKEELQVDLLELNGGSELEAAKLRKKAEIIKFDQSEAVNQFMLVGKQMWLPKETRVGLVNSISIEKAAGKQNTVLWFDGVRYEIPIEQALKMLGALEMYALECYNVTHKHLSEVDKLLSVDAVAGYDHKAGYPEKLNFDSMEVKVCC